MEKIQLFFKWLFNIQDKPKKIETEALTKTNYDEYDEWMRLAEEKQHAIAECDGCRDEVFILLKNDEEIGYYSSLKKLADKNNFPIKSIYNYYNRSKSNNKTSYKKVYKIIKLE